ncbi:MAG: SH3 domain-containing protein, partial [Syntrophomonadaceae bacterium]|nr:SH3 domain-containing protein [Syntrophomonadaceae bacterium]
MRKENTLHMISLWLLGSCLALTMSLGLLVRPVLTQTGMVTGSVVNVRSGPGTQYSVAGSLYKDSEVEVLSQSGEWYKVQFSQVTGWLHQSLLKLGPTGDSDIVIIVSKDQVNLRSGPGTSYPIVGEAARGEALTLIDVADAWYKAKTSTGKVVYIRADMTSPANGNTESEDKTSHTVSSVNSSGPVASPFNTVDKVPSIILDGQTMTFEVDPVVENNRVLVPLRAIFEAMGATVTWNQVTQTATATKDDIKVILPLNSTAPTVNGKVWPLDVPAKVVKQRTLAPLRFVGEALGGTATWDGDKNRITLTSPQNEHDKVVAVVITADTVNLRRDPVVSNNNLVGSANYGERL